MSEKPARFESQEAVSEIVIKPRQDGPPELLVVHEPIAVELLSAPIDDRLDAMLARLHDRDFLGAFVHAESVLAASEHGLARICRDEAFPHVKAFLEGHTTVGVAALRDLHERLQNS